MGVSRTFDDNRWRWGSDVLGCSDRGKAGREPFTRELVMMKR
jgi:hypothetical protein